MSVRARDLPVSPAPSYPRLMAFTDPKPAPGPAAFVAGATLGCLFFVALMFVPLFVWAWSGAHCEPQPGCQSSSGGYLLRSALLALGPCVLLGAALRSLFHWLGRKFRAQEPGAADQEPTPWWAFVAVPLALLGGPYLVLGEPLWRL